MHRVHTGLPRRCWGYGSSEPCGVGRTSKGIPAPGISPGETAPALAQLTEHGSALERRWHNTQERQELPSVPSPGGHNLPLAGWGGASVPEEQPHLHGGRAKSLFQPHLESQAGILVPPRSDFPTSTKAVEQVLSGPARVL